jgi:hypothetical protein
VVAEVVALGVAAARVVGAVLGSLSSPAGQLSDMWVEVVSTVLIGAFPSPGLRWLLLIAATFVHVLGYVQMLDQFHEAPATAPAASG